MVTVKITDRHFSDGQTEIELSKVQYMKLKLNQSICIGKRKKAGWSGEAQFYISTCERHGYFLDYQHGWKNHFQCPECYQRELLRSGLAPKLARKSKPIAIPIHQTKSLALSKR
ncbi:MAG: hypothetical protein LUP94_00515 [Candidatus Methanomethylicus sp.]|nr:hypothetical protein [Candidatus Methanomethylicus sp.]